MRYAFPELRTMDIAARVFDEEIRMMNMDPSQRPLEMAIEGVGDIINKIWEAIKKILTAIPNLCKKLIEKIKDSKLIASKNVNKADQLPASASSLSSEKLSKFKSYRAEIDSNRKKLMHKTRDCIQSTMKHCDDLNSEIIPVLEQVDESNFFSLNKNTKYDSGKVANFKSQMEKDKKLLAECKSQAEEVSRKIKEFSNEVGDEKMFGEWMPNYSGDEDYESLINELSSKSDKYLEQTEKLEKKFHAIRTKIGDKVHGTNSDSNSAYQLLQTYQENTALCNDIVQTYANVATVVYAVYTQGVEGKEEDAKGVSGSKGWVWNDKDKKNAHWDFVARVRLESGKQIMLTYAYNNEKDGSKQPTRDIKQVEKDILNDYNKNRANGDPAKEVIGQGVFGQAGSAIKNDAKQTVQDVKNVADKVKKFWDLNKLVSTAKSRGYSEDAINKLKSDFNDGNVKVNSMGSFDEWVSRNIPDARQNSDQDENQQNNNQNQQNNNNQQGNNNNQNQQNNQQNNQNNNNANSSQNNNQNQQNNNNKTAYNTIADTLARGNISVDQAQKLIKMIPKQTEASDTKAQKLIQDAINENRKNNKANNDDKNDRAKLAQQINSGKVEGANSKIKINSSYLKILVDNLSNSTISVDQAQKILSNVSYMDDVNDFQNKVKEAADENKKHHYSDNDDKKNKAKYIEELKNQYGRAAGGLLFAKREKERAFGKGYPSAKDAAYLTDEMYERALEYVYDYGMPFEDAVEAVLEEVEAEENSYIDAAVESLFADEFDDIDYSKAYYQEDDEDRWDNFLT